ncbi:hypothetical protein FCV25MIE_22300 [Fagus crenata]
MTTTATTCHLSSLRLLTPYTTTFLHLLSPPPLSPSFAPPPPTPTCIPPQPPPSPHSLAPQPPPPLPLPPHSSHHHFHSLPPSFTPPITTTTITIGSPTQNQETLIRLAFPLSPSLKKTKASSPTKPIPFDL